MLLAAAGVCLWLPRGRFVGVLVPRRTSGRALWRDVHPATGACAAVFILFLALTGLPWSGVWGGEVLRLRLRLRARPRDAGRLLGRLSDLNRPHGRGAGPPRRGSWSGQPMPVSGASEGVPAGLAQVAARVEAPGIHPGYAPDMPGGAAGRVRRLRLPNVGLQRVIHLDQYAGEVLFDMRHADLGALGRAAERGISVHMGQEFGVANQVLMLLGCLAIVLMPVSAMVMWWKRRPAGSLGAPRPPADWRAPRAVLLMVLAAGIFFPLVGLSLAAILVIDLVLPPLLRRRVA